MRFAKHELSWIVDIRLTSQWVTKVKLDINLIKVHSQLSHNGLSMDGALVDVGSFWPIFNPLTLHFGLGNLFC